LFASLAGTASAGTILDVFTQGDLFSFTDTGSSETAVVTSGVVTFEFQIATALGPAFTPVTGLLNFDASTTAEATGPDGNGNYDEGGWSSVTAGTITDTQAGAYQNVVIFSFTFGPSGALSVAAAGTGGTFFDSTPPLSPPEVSFSSPILNFGNVTSQSFSIGLGGDNNWAVASGPPGYLVNNTASAVLTFVSNPEPTPLPEPATMVMLGSALIGLGLIGRKRFSRQGAAKQ
jgi:hypothetical protein